MFKLPVRCIKRPHHVSYSTGGDISAKKHSFIIAAAAMAAAVVLGTACTRKPAVETMETVTTEAPTEETTKPQPTATQPEETSAEAPQYKEMYHMLQGTVTKVTGDGEGVHPSGGRWQGL